MSESQSRNLLLDRFGPGPEPHVVSVPGRVNLIGEHIDYHNLPVLPVAIQRRVTIAFRPRSDNQIRAVSASQSGAREFEWTPRLTPSPAGDWANYLKAAAQAINTKWTLSRGIDAAIVSDLPPAAGLSSSSALLVGFTLALLKANGVPSTFDELMDILPDGEHFVGTRGGGMDHAAVLASKPGNASLIRFAPVSVEHVPIPADWAFLVAHSLTTAEKSGTAKAEYNSRRSAGDRALERLGFPSFRAAVENHSPEELHKLADTQLDGQERGTFLHTVEEAARVLDAVGALRRSDATAFGHALNASHDSMRDQLRISCVALDELVEVAQRAGAMGARLTGAGFGGCAVIACERADRDRIAGELVERFYSRRKEFDPATHLIAAEPSSGALHD